MIVHDQILPSLYQLQRIGRIGRIRICDASTARMRDLVEGARFREAFPDSTFEAFPPLETSPEEQFPDLYKEVLASAASGDLAVVAVPDHLHERMIRQALECDQHVLTVKPLVSTYADGIAIEQLARERGLFVGVEYHKRFDRRALDAKRLYTEGRFGDFRMGEAKMIEPYAYRHSNFQNWFTKENSDPFTYVGCHYVDLVQFITGLRPVEVSVRGVEGAFPNGNIGYLWANGRVVWENGAVLTVSDGLGYPDQAAGMNDQGLVMYCEGPDGGAVLKHDDQYRGVRHGYLAEKADGPTAYRFVSPDYFRLVPWAGEGLRPVGYGYESIEALVEAAIEVRSAGESLDAKREAIDAIDKRGLLATPANSFYNELTTEAARMSILRDGLPVEIQYDPTPRVALRGDCK